MRELEFSKITLRLVNKDDPKDSSEEHTVAKLTGDTLPTLQRILVCGINILCNCDVHTNMLYSTNPRSLFSVQIAER